MHSTRVGKVLPCRSTEIPASLPDYVAGDEVEVEAAVMRAGVVYLSHARVVSPATPALDVITASVLAVRFPGAFGVAARLGAGVGYRD
jgi:hypothetical protein